MANLGRFPVSIIDILIIALLSYGLGCISFAYYLVRILIGEDIRELESGTAGARNVARVLGRPVGFAVMASEKGIGVMDCLRLYDFIKGKEIVISMPRCDHYPGIKNSSQNVLRADEKTAALIENHERLLISLEKAS